MALVAVASLLGVGGAAADSEGSGFLNLVSSVRGAANQALPTPASTFQTLPAAEGAFLDRGAPALVPTTPLPTPIAIDPAATPLAAPGSDSTEVAAAPAARAAAPAPAPVPVPPPPAVGALVWPVPAGSISQYFHAGHLALDIAADYGAQVVAAQSGVVVAAGWRSNGGGYVIEIDHGNGMKTLYNHLGSIWVTAGQTVFAGQGIAGVGCTGLCTGPHVHFQVIVNGVIDNPQRYF